MQAGHYKYLKHQRPEVTPHLQADNSIMKVYQQAKNNRVSEVFKLKNSPDQFFLTALLVR